jgi:hypothetical protein
MLARLVPSFVIVTVACAARAQSITLVAAGS